MAVQQDRKFGSFSVSHAYVRIVKGSIRGGGPGGWFCSMEVFAKPEDAQVIESSRSVDEIPDHMKRDPSNGQPLSAEQLQKMADALPPMRRLAAQPLPDRFDFPPSTGPGVIELVPDDGETHPAKALYTAYMDRNPGAKQA